MDPKKKENRAVREFVLKKMNEVAKVVAPELRDAWTYEQWRDGEVPASEVVDTLTDLIDKLMRARTRMSYYTEKRDG